MDQVAEVRPDPEELARRERERRRAALESKQLPIVTPEELRAAQDPERTAVMQAQGDTARRILRDRIASGATRIARKVLP